VNVSSSPSVIRINGNPISYSSNLKISEQDIKDAIKEAANAGMKILVNPKGKKAAEVSLYSVSGIMLAQIMVTNMRPSMWSELSPIFKVFQEIAMVTGALSVITGLIIMVFNKRLGWTIINTAACVVLGCFLVPSAVMLIAIVGSMLDRAISHAFEAFQQQGF
jgi:hypothetical protein